MVSQLLFPSWKWKGIHVWPGLVLSDTWAVVSREPRRDVTRTRLPSAMPRAAASASFSSMNELPDSAPRPSVRPVIAHALYWASTRPVIMASGYSSSGSSAEGR